MKVQVFVGQHMREDCIMLKLRLPLCGHRSTHGIFTIKQW
jgi:hypothetical protein